MIFSHKAHITDQFTPRWISILGCQTVTTVASVSTVAQLASFCAQSLQGQQHQLASSFGKSLDSRCWHLFSQATFFTLWPITSALDLTMKVKSRPVKAAYIKTVRRHHHCANKSLPRPRCLDSGATEAGQLRAIVVAVRC